METKLIKVDPSNMDPAIRQAHQILNQGGLVAFPTETVYGLAANAKQTHSLARLARIKQRPADKPFTLHIGDKLVLDRYVPGLSLINRHFLRKAWPGPVTVIFQLNEAQQETVRQNLPAEQVKALYHNSSIGIRLPDHPTAQRLLQGFEGPVVAPSANLSGSPSPICVEDVLEQLDGQIELALDAGPTRYAKSSTIIKLAGDEYEVLRAGVLDEGSIGRMRAISILFVCTGNCCRSPMAEGYCKKELSRKLGYAVDQLAVKGYKIESAGVMAYPGAAASAESVQVCGEAGVDISSHRARLLTAEMLGEADFVFVMDQAHQRAIRQMAAPRGAEPVLLAKDGEIADPIGQPVETYRSCADLIFRSIRERLEQMFARES